MSADYRSIIYNAVMKAYREGELAITYPSKSMASHMRMRIYSFMKAQRARPDAKQEFLDAAEEVTITIRDCVMVITRKSKMEGFAAMARALEGGASPTEGLAEGIPPDPHAPDLKHQDARASFERFQAMMREQGKPLLEENPTADPEVQARLNAYKGRG